jgi:hypothetical protein
MLDAVLWSKLGAAALLGISLVACSGSNAVSETAPLDECPNLVYSPCDVRRAACQVQLQELAACIYGVFAMPRVPVRVMNEQQLIDELGSEPSDPIETPERVVHPQLERALVDLGLLQAGGLSADGAWVADSVQRMHSVYRDERRGIVLIDRGLPLDGVEEDGWLVHELVHALQDQQYGLESWRQQYASDVDTELALRAVTEGQATFVQYRAWAAMAGKDANYVDWVSTFINLRQGLLASALADASPYLASDPSFPFGFGAVLAHARWQTEGPVYHATQFADPPQTSLGVIAQGLNGTMPSFAAAPFQAPMPSDEFSVVEETVLGAFLLHVSAHQLGDEGTNPFTLSLAWRGDRLWVYSGPNDQTAWLWQLQVADDTTAQKLHALANTAGGPITAEAQGSRLFLLGAGAPQFLFDAGRAFLGAD